MAIIRQATRHHTEGRAVPSLQIVPRLQTAGDGDGAAVGFAPSLALRAGLAALAIAAAAAAVVFVITHGSHRQSRNTAWAALHANWPKTPALPRYTGPESAVAWFGVRLSVPGSSGTSPASAHPSSGGSTASSTPAVSYAHELSSADVISLADRGTSYAPSAELAEAYREAASPYGIPWRLLAAIEYIQGGYVDAFAGESAPAEQALAATYGVDGQRAVNPHVLADAVASTSQPSAQLAGLAKQLAADGAAQSPAQAVDRYLHGSSTSVPAVLTLAQAIGEAPVTSSAGPLLKLTAMENEARLLNGLPYIWGGGHTNPAWVVSSGYDCSGFVSEVLHAGGYLDSPDTTQTLPGSAGILNGPGKYVTIYDRTVATVKVWVKKQKIVTVRKAVNPATIGVHVDKGRHSNSINSVAMQIPKWVGQWKTVKITKLVRSADTTNNDEHVIIDLDGQWWESGGSTADGGAAQVHRILDPSPGYLKTFNRILHPSGL
jgi:cell wall-associated NlpC family hydrolase